MNTRAYSFIKKHLGVLIILSSFVGLFLILPKSLRGMDDIVYLNMADHFFSESSTTLYNNNAKNISVNIFGFRVVWLFIVWLSIKIFGYKTIAILFPAMLSTLGTALLVYKMSAQRKNLSTALFLFSPAIFSISFYGTPDTTLMFFFTLSYFFLYRHVNHIGKHWENALLLCLSLFIGFFVKELIVFFIPLLAFQFVYDFKKKHNLDFWKYAVIFSLLLGSVYFGWNWIQYQDIFYRANIFTGNQYVSHCSYDILPKIEVVKRITLGFPFMVISTLSIILIVPLLQYLKEKQLTVLSFHLIILLITSNFASIKIGSYSPMCLEIRHYLFLFPIAAVLIGNAQDLMLNNLKSSFINFCLILFFSIILILKFYFKKDYDISSIDVFFYIGLLLIFSFIKNHKYSTTLIVTICIFFSVHRQIFDFHRNKIYYKEYIKNEKR